MAEKDNRLTEISKKAKSFSTNSLVLDSLSSALESSLPVVLTDSTPNKTPPSLNQKKSNKLKLHNLLRPLSPGFKSDSDDSPTSPKRRHSPHIRRKKLKVRNGQTKSADNSPVRSDRDVSPSLLDGLETTQVNSLPGQIEIQKRESKNSIGVPTILVSPDEENGFGLERKTSQSSHLSATSSIITSGAKDCSKPSRINTVLLLIMW